MATLLNNHSLDLYFSKSLGPQEYLYKLVRSTLCNFHLKFEMQRHPATGSKVWSCNTLRHNFGEIPRLIAICQTCLRPISGFPKKIPPIKWMKKACLRISNLHQKWSKLAALIKVQTPYIVNILENCKTYWKWKLFLSKKPGMRSLPSYSD